MSECACMGACTQMFLRLSVDFCEKERTNNIFTGFNFLGVMPAIVRVRGVLLVL